jgi:hypothetical protein
MDKNNPKSKSEYYHFFYKKDDQIIQSDHSKKPSSEFNSTIDSLSFIEGTLFEDYHEKFKINPLWISSIDIAKSKINFFSPNSFRYEIKFGKLENNLNEFIDESSIDKFFL